MVYFRANNKNYKFIEFLFKIQNIFSNTNLIILFLTDRLEIKKRRASL